MNILLAGASGQLGQELAPLLGALGRLIPVDRAPGLPGTVQMDLTDFEAVGRLLDERRPDAVVNAAAYTAVDQAESAVHDAFRLNAGLPDTLARWCARNDRALLHYSTDYVFDGSLDRPWREQDRPNPLSVYGETKLAGEWAVTASGCRHLVLRTSWVYSTHGSNFVLTMLKLARERPSLSIVGDQRGCPTWARNLARVSADLLGRLVAPAEEETSAAPHGIYHYCDDDAVTWYHFARLIFEQAVTLGHLQAMPRLQAIASAEFPQPARRPANSVLDTTAIRAAFGVQPPELAASLRTCLEELEP
ncbi:dTDP-4-dehydrorhamnose reductase [Elongatibacter sediminis]|uniref:dTDP-4-dehydrorhamnose reductase n=1 Tax=Elongatibacter sediminis TaxID=3119006 RepID=A0AAW9RGK5_9GAMM